MVLDQAKALSCDSVEALALSFICTLLQSPHFTRVQCPCDALCACQPQEREAAAKLLEDGSVAAMSAAKTFEPGEGLEGAAAGANGAGEDEEEEAAAAVPKAAAAPTAEQLTAIKAAIANAQTLEEAERLEAALREGKLPSELAALGGGKQQQQEQDGQQQNGEAMEEG